MKLFYDHLLIELNDVYAEIERLEIEPEERVRLARVVDETAHHTVVGVILKHLPTKHHETFLEKLHAAPHDRKHLEFLKQEIDDIEGKITASLKELKKAISQELRTAKKG